VELNRSVFYDLQKNIVEEVYEKPKFSFVVKKKHFELIKPILGVFDEKLFEKSEKIVDMQENFNLCINGLINGLKENDLNDVKVKFV